MNTDFVLFTNYLSPALDLGYRIDAVYAYFRVVFIRVLRTIFLSNRRNRKFHGSVIDNSVVCYFDRGIIKIIDLYNLNIYIFLITSSTDNVFKSNRPVAINFFACA